MAKELKKIEAVEFVTSVFVELITANAIYSAYVKNSQVRQEDIKQQVINFEPKYYEQMKNLYAQLIKSSNKDIKNRMGEDVDELYVDNKKENISAKTLNQNCATNPSIVEKMILDKILKIGKNVNAVLEPENNEMKVLSDNCYNQFKDFEYVMSEVSNICLTISKTIKKYAELRTLQQPIQSSSSAGNDKDPVEFIAEIFDALCDVNCLYAQYARGGQKEWERICEVGIERMKKIESFGKKTNYLEEIGQLYFDITGKIDYENFTDEDRIKFFDITRRCESMVNSKGYAYCANNGVYPKGFYENCVKNPGEVEHYISQRTIKIITKIQNALKNEDGKETEYYFTLNDKFTNIDKLYENIVIICTNIGGTTSKMKKIRERETIKTF